MDKEAVQKIRQKLKRAILVNMIVLPLIPFLAVTAVSFYFFANALETGTREKLMRILSDHSRMIDTFLMNRRADLELVSRIYSRSDLEAPGALEQVYKNLAEHSQAFVDLGLFDDRGTHLRYVGAYALAGRSYAEEPWFRKTMAEGHYISDVFLGYRNSPHFVVAVRRREAGNTWVLRATIDTLFFDTLVSGIRMGSTGEAYILNHAGLAQTTRRSGDIGFLEKDPAFGWISDLVGTDLRSGVVTPKGQPFVYAASRVKGRSWILVVRQEKSDAYRALYSAGAIGFVITVCGLALLAATALFTSERIIRRIDLLGEEKEALGNQLIRAVQLAEIGEMAAGFAHEINNPLQIIKGEYALLKVLMGDVFPEGTAGPGKDGPDQYRQSDQDKVPDRDAAVEDIRESLEQISVQVARCHKITAAILKFGRKNEPCHTALEPGKVIPEIIALVENTVKLNGIDLKVDLSPDTPCFTGDAPRFQQVMLNLMNNAVDAVTQRHGSRGGRIEIAACAAGEAVNGSGRVEIQVRDNGCGINPDHMNRIFSPFFTTKAVGRGTGLGLSVCYGIIESFGGTMAVESRPDEGTVFSVSLPAKASV